MPTAKSLPTIQQVLTAIEAVVVPEDRTFDTSASDAPEKLVQLLSGVFVALGLDHPPLLPQNVRREPYEPVRGENLLSLKVTILPTATAISWPVGDAFIPVILPPFVDLTFSTWCQPVWLPEDFKYREQFLRLTYYSPPLFEQRTCRMTSGVGK